MKRFLRVMLLIALSMAGCTSIGIGDKSALNRDSVSEPEVLRICIYKDVAVPDQRAEEIIGAITGEFALHGLQIEVPWIRPWQRPAFEMDGIIKDISTRPLESPCDRLFGVVGRDYRDFMWGLLMPEILGAVEDATLTKGYTVGEWGSLNQVLSFKSPAETAVHEAYHLLGCKHGLFANSCYKQVQDIRKVAQYNRQQGQDFFPAVNLNGRIFWTRADVDSFLGVDQRTANYSFSSERCDGIAELPSRTQ
jgi:hypothetical protein